MNFQVQSNLEFTNKNSDVVVLAYEKEAISDIVKEFKLDTLQVAELNKSKSRFLHQGKIFHTIKVEKSDDTMGHGALLDDSAYAVAREQVGSRIAEAQLESKASVDLCFYLSDKDALLGALVGIEVSLYRFSKSLTLNLYKLTNFKKVLNEAILNKAILIGISLNQARHLVNLPPNDLNPVSYANEISKMYAKSKTIKVKVYDEKMLEKEKCGLLLCVGKSSKFPPRIVHLKYHPKDAKGKAIALVGKGLTFDSGGLDIKPPAGMRLMKKDMGGSATLIGLSRWLESSGIKKKVDIYVALAENSISENSARPSDIYTSRAGHKVEIHNTDAEGRLALADAISIALDNKPEVLIDVATLTGAGKVSLGTDIASLFSNDDKLSNDLIQAGVKMGDLSWRMPLYRPYNSDFKSDYADFTNAGVSGFAGSITAALFLEKFIPNNVKWAHFDIYSWTTSSRPSMIQKGGNGQTVETLISYLS